MNFRLNRTARVAAIAGLLLTVVGGCSTPRAMQSTQSEKLQASDSFSLVADTGTARKNAAYDQAVLQSLASMTAGPSPSGRTWLVEYSFAARPAAIGMTAGTPNSSQVYGLPRSNLVLDCKETSYRLTVRLIAADNGKEIYKGSAEEHSCEKATADGDAIFTRLLSGSLSGL